MPLNAKLLSVKIRFKKVKISLMLIHDVGFFIFCLTDLFPSLSDILVYEEDTSKETN